MPPAGGAGAKSGFLCGGEGLVGGRRLAGLLLELGRRSTDRCLAAWGPPTCCWNWGAARVGLFGEPTVLMLELLLQVKKEKEKKVEPSGSPGPIPVQPDSGPIHRTRPKP